ncbi:uncharacterized protein LOC113220327, partial [Piliocolobus tephrosceles]|uniref:uncharacterized protein LOC113220327 n=1 Tax=Piliocolobus tephrosceles TaxID=591936 RepID=UPI000E6B3618
MGLQVLEALREGPKTAIPGLLPKEEVKLDGAAHPPPRPRDCGWAPRLHSALTSRAAAPLRWPQAAAARGRFDFEWSVNVVAKRDSVHRAPSVSKTSTHLRSRLSGPSRLLTCAPQGPALEAAGDPSERPPQASSCDRGGGTLDRETVLGPTTFGAAVRRHFGRPSQEFKTSLANRKQPAMPWDQNPEQSNGNYSENEQKGEQKWREGGEAGGKREREKEEENEKELEDEQENRKRENKKQYSKDRLVSKSLMDTLWSKFKLNRCPTIQESLSLSFEFGMTHKQISQWFCKKRKKYNREMSKRKYKEKQTRWVSMSCQGWSRTPA